MAVINASHDMRSKNLDLLEEFSEYCALHPQERFWQALRNWAKVPTIAEGRQNDGFTHYTDTFYWEGKNG